jgi:hypothetical protein
MKKYIYKLTYKNYETGAGEPDFEKYFLSFLKMKKFLKERGFLISKGTIKITGSYGFYIIEKIEVQE